MHILEKAMKTISNVQLITGMHDFLTIHNCASRRDVSKTPYINFYSISILCSDTSYKNARLVGQDSGQTCALNSFRSQILCVITQQYPGAPDEKIVHL